MLDDFNVKCIDCGYDKFNIQWCGIHARAYCANCDKMLKKDGYALNLKMIEDELYEPATGAQIGSIKRRAYSQSDCLSKIQAGDIIAIFEQAVQDEYQRQLKEEEE